MKKILGALSLALSCHSMAALTEFEAKKLCGDIAMKRHENGGGWISIKAHVDRTAFISKDAIVCGGQIGGGAQLLGYVEITGMPQIGGGVHLVADKTTSLKNIELWDDKVPNEKVRAKIPEEFFKIRISGDDELGHARIGDQVKIMGPGNIHGSVSIYGRLSVRGPFEFSKNVTINNVADQNILVKGNFHENTTLSLSDGVSVLGDSIRLIGGVKIEGNIAIGSGTWIEALSPTQNAIWIRGEGEIKKYKRTILPGSTQKVRMIWNGQDYKIKIEEPAILE